MLRAKTDISAVPPEFPVSRTLECCNGHTRPSLPYLRESGSGATIRPPPYALAPPAHSLYGSEAKPPHPSQYLLIPGYFIQWRSICQAQMGIISCFSANGGFFSETGSGNPAKCRFDKGITLCYNPANNETSGGFFLWFGPLFPADWMSF